MLTKLGRRLWRWSPNSCHCMLHKSKKLLLHKDLLLMHGLLLLLKSLRLLMYS